jgi:small acid-soluble spore protein H (minor)
LAGLFILWLNRLREVQLVVMTTNNQLNVQRAMEIAQAPDMKNVTLDGENVYIQHVDPVTETARVFPLSRLDERGPEQEVPVSSLIEHIE